MNLLGGAPVLILVLALASGCSGRPLEPAAAAEEVARPAGPRFPVAYLDMDGTLLDSGHALRPASARALADYQACGGRFGLATGRTFEQVRPFLEQISPDLPLVLFNGALVTDPAGQQVLFANALPGALVAELLREFGGDERVALVLVQDAERSLAYPDSARVDEIAGGMHVSVARRCAAPERCLAPGDPDPLKLLVVTEGEQAAQVLSAHQGAIPPGVRAVVGHPSAVEIVAEDANKGAAIRQVLAQLGVGVDQVVVFGDSGNDVEMLTDIPVSVAMEQCHPESCAAALLRAGSNDSDTIAEILERLLMGPGCTPPR